MEEIENNNTLLKINLSFTHYQEEIMRRTKFYLIKKLFLSVYELDKSARIASYRKIKFFSEPDTSNTEIITPNCNPVFRQNGC